jgi:hypothetical protein
LSTPFEQDRAKSGGPSRAEKHRKGVFELYHGYTLISPKDRAIRWLNPRNIAKYETSKVFEFEQQSARRDRLCAVYHMVSQYYHPSTSSNCKQFGFAAILDPAFNPTRNSKDSDWVSRCVHLLDDQISDLERSNPDEPLDTRVQRSRHAEEIIKFIVISLGSATEVSLYQDFRCHHRPRVDSVVIKMEEPDVIDLLDDE